MPDLLLPQELLNELEKLPGFDRVLFEQTHYHPEQVVSLRINPAKFVYADKQACIGEEQWQNLSRVPWSSYGYYLPKRPQFVFDPLFHAGQYYVQEASSMFLEQAVKQTVDLSKSIRVLDLCAAPGGKSTLIQSLLSDDSLLVSNEVIRSRVHVLQENMTKWGYGNGLISQCDPAIFSRVENYFDLVVVDAPCSGSGLFRKDPGAIAEWSLEQVRNCSLRQRRIIEDVWPALKEGGVMIYSTCSYSAVENEEILDGLIDKYAADPIALDIDPAWNIVTSLSPEHGAAGYRFYPDHLQGEGFFIACLRKKDDGNGGKLRLQRQSFVEPNKNEKSWLHHFIKPDLALQYFKRDDDIYAVPELLAADFQYLMKSLYVKKCGVLLGKAVAKELVPHHELALSGWLNANLRSAELDHDAALGYLRKQEFTVPTEEKGWTVVRYQGAALGWMKVLPNRVNNYYPVEWRILKKSIEG